MTVNFVVGVIVGLIAILVGFAAYEVCGSWILSSLVFLTVAGFGLYSIDAVSRKLANSKEEADAE